MGFGLLKKGVNIVNKLDFNNLIIGNTASGKMNVPPIYFFLCRVRTEKNETSQNMAKKLGLDEEQLTSIEHGRVPNPKGFFSKLYTIYNLPIEFGTLELWDKIEQHLYDSRLKNESLETKGVPPLDVLLAIIRYESGERSSDLHSQIWRDLI